MHCNPFITYPWRTLQHTNILQYVSIYFEIVIQILYSTSLCLVTLFFFKTAIVPHYSTKMSLLLP
jgi:hypothetical protein